MTPQQLKDSILQLAIEGKLVSQIESEGNAEDLYKQIQKKQGKLSLQKDEVNLSAMDFDIPQNWRWVELNQLFDFVDYRGKTPKKTNEGVFLITASNVRKGYMDYSRKEYISPEEYGERQSRGITHKGDLLFTTEAPMGNASICDLEICSVGQRVITFQPYCDNSVVPSLFMFFILSPKFQKQILDNSTGTTAKGIKGEKLKHIIIPLPPLAEQKRIVAKINELMPMVDKYGEAYNQLNELEKQFPADLKKSVLQYAMKGKLVPQIESEGNAEDLYKQIQKEKAELIKKGIIKKEKPLAPITEDEVPFDIPQSWKWVRIPSVSFFQEGPGILGKDFRTNGVPLIRIAGMQGSIVSLNGCNYLDPAMVEEKWKHFKLDFGDLVISASASLDKIAIVDDEATGAIPYTGLIRFKVYEGLVKDFLIRFFQSPIFTQQIDEMKKGEAIKHYGPTHLQKMVIPLPPSAEQKRIVEKIEELFSIIDKRQAK